MPSDSKEWFLTKSQAYEPGKTLRLGQVLLNERKPGDALFSKVSSEVAISDDYVQDHSESKNMTIEFENKTKAAFKAWGEANGAPVAANSHGESSTENKRKWVLKKLESDMFTPDIEYARSVLKAGDVSGAIKWWRLRRRIFLVTGVRIARGASVSVEEVGKSLVDMKLKASDPTQQVPVRGGIEINKEHDAKHVETTEEASDFVFAYRLHEIAWLPDVDKRVVTRGDTEAVGDQGTAYFDADETADDEDQIVGYELDGLNPIRGYEDMVD